MAKLGKELPRKIDAHKINPNKEEVNLKQKVTPVIKTQ